MKIFTNAEWIYLESFLDFSLDEAEQTEGNITNYGYLP